MEKYKMDEKGWVYGLVSLISNDWYIGETGKTLMERFKGHMTDANRVWSRTDKVKRESIHKSIWRIGFENWIILPITREPIQNIRKDLELTFINKLKPNLNSKRIC